MLARTVWVTAAALFALAGPVAAANAPGVTATEIKIGNTMPYSGPASAYGTIGRAETAFFKMVNEHGGINGRKIDFISYDDGYSPPKTVEQVRRLVEQDNVAFVFNTLGTPSNTAIQKYLNSKKIPQLFVATGASKWGDPEHFHWTMGWQTDYRSEARIYARYILKEKPNAKIGILYQNDDFGKDYVVGLEEGLGNKAKSMIVLEASYEVTDPTVESQIVSLQASGADTLLVAATPKFAAQSIRKVHDIGWKPLFFMTNVSSSVGAVMRPAGAENGVGIISATYGKDPTDPQWNDDPAMKKWRAFMNQYYPEGDQNDGANAVAYGVASTLVQVLKQCGNDLSRANVMKQAANLKDFDGGGLLLPGISINTSPTDYYPIQQMQLEKWDGKVWVRFGDVISGASS